MDIMNLNDLLSLQLNELVGIEHSSQEILNLIRGKATNTDLIAVLDRYILETKSHQQKLQEIAQAEGLEIETQVSLITQAMQGEAQELLGKTNDSLITDIVVTALGIKLQALSLAAYEMAIKTAILSNFPRVAGDLRTIQGQCVKVAGLLSKIIEGYQAAK